MRHAESRQRTGFIRAIRRRVRFARDERGATAVEFALLALPFFTVIGAIIETAIAFLAGQVLESAVHDVSRLIRTGQSQPPITTPAYDANAFRTKVCERGFGLFDCSQLKVRVRVVSSFAASMTSLPIDPDTGDWSLTESYSNGDRNEILIAEVYYKWPSVFNFMGFNIGDTADGKKLLGAARVWRNEPF